MIVCLLLLTLSCQLLRVFPVKHGDEDRVMLCYMHKVAIDALDSGF